MSEEPRWLTWVREMQAVAQSGLTYARDQHDRERYNRLGELAAEIMSEYTKVDAQQIMMLFAELDAQLSAASQIEDQCLLAGKYLLSWRTTRPAAAAC